MNDPVDYNIRPAVKKDVPLILNFIKKLAVYERKSDLVCATEKDIEKYMFGLKIAEGIIGECSSKPAGFAIFFQNFSTFLGKPGIYIEDLFVEKEMRKRGLGIAMFSYIARMALERGCGFLEWSVLKWNKPSIDLYKKMGAGVKDEWDLYRLAGDPLKRLADHK